MGRIENLISVLPTGKENAIHQKDLAHIIGVTQSRVKETIKEAREQGIEILSGNSGYYKPKNNEERKRYVEMQHKQAISRFVTSKAVKDKLQNVDGQIMLPDIDDI